MSLRLTQPYAIALDYYDGGPVSAFTGTLGDRQWLYIASTQNDDDTGDRAPIRITVTLPEHDSAIAWGAENAALMFRAPGMSAHCSESSAVWSGAIRWLRPMPDYAIAIDATCAADSASRAAGVLTGNL